MMDPAIPAKLDQTKGDSVDLDVPETVRIELTNVCNARCSFCWQHEVERSRTLIEPELFQSAVDQAVALGVSRIHFHISGEPTIHPELPAFIAYARQRGIAHARLVTNGVLLTEDLAQKVVDAGITEILFSLMSVIEPYYENITKLPFKKARAAISNVIKAVAGKPGVKVEFRCIDYPDIHEEQVRSIELMNRNVQGHENIAFTLKGLHSFGGENKTRNYSDIDAGREDKAWVGLTAGVQESRCGPIRKSINIYADGSIAACCVDLDKKCGDFGNMKETPLQEIWANSGLSRLRSLHKKGKMSELPAFCQQCLESGMFRTEEID